MTSRNIPMQSFNSFFVDTLDSSRYIVRLPNELSIHSLLIPKFDIYSNDPYATALSIHSLLIPAEEGEEELGEEVLSIHSLLIPGLVSVFVYVVDAFNSFFVDTEQGKRGEHAGSQSTFNSFFVDTVTDLKEVVEKPNTLSIHSLLIPLMYAEASVTSIAFFQFILC